MKIELFSLKSYFWNGEDKKIENIKKIGFEVENRNIINNPIEIEIDSLEELFKLQYNINYSLIIDSPNIVTIYNDYIE